MASARADVAEAEANHAAAVAGPTKEERAIADAQVKAAASALAVLERRLDKTILRAPADGVVSVIVAEVGENIHAGQPVLVIEETGKHGCRSTRGKIALHGLTVGTKVDVARAGAREQCRPSSPSCVPLGSFATWQAERAVGDHTYHSRAHHFRAGHAHFHARPHCLTGSPGWSCLCTGLSCYAHFPA